MKYLLDSNICIHFLRGNYNIIDKLNEVGIDNCAISEITLAELVFGAEKSDNPNKNHKLIEKFIGQMSILPIFDAIQTVSAPFIKGHKLRKKIRNYEYENDRQRH